MNGRPMTPSLIGRLMKSLGSLQSYTCASPIRKLPHFVWNLAMRAESGWSLPSNWLIFEVTIWMDVGFTVTKS